MPANPSPNKMRYLILIVFALPAFAQTAINDKPAAAMLLGTHPLSLQWVTFDTTKGSVTITEANGVYRLKGEQKGKDNNLLSIDGEVTAINAKDFTFKGKIVTRVSHIANGKDCVRDGTFLFRISGARQFWRMREQQNPCDEAADYIDIFFPKTK
jgi:hypothetical protein